MSHCEHYRELMMKKTIAPLSAHDDAKLADHLSGCPKCRAFEQRVLAIASADDNAASLRPAPALKQALIRRMRDKRREKKAPAWRGLRHFFTYRVALYQAALVSLLLLFLVLAAPKLKSPRQVSTSQFTPSVADTMSMNVINLNQIIQIVDSQKVGVNLREDTVLAKILYTL